VVILQETAYFRNGLKMTTTKALPNDLIDRLLFDYKNPEDLIGENGLLKQFTKAVIERVLQSEMTAHLGHDIHAPVTNETRNARNGKSNKTLKGDFGELPIEIPRDPTAASNRN
jgi:putative transposase